MTTTRTPKFGSSLPINTFYRKGERATESRYSIPDFFDNIEIKGDTIKEPGFFGKTPFVAIARATLS